MRKIPTLFVRDPETHRVTEEVTPGCEWVLNGEGIATVKYDGTACLVTVDNYLKPTLRKRHTVKMEDITPPWPTGFQPSGQWQNGKQPGWMPVGDGPEDQYHREAFEIFLSNDENFEDDMLKFEAIGTYELCGPKIRGNPERYVKHTLTKHGSARISQNPRTFEAIKDYLGGHNVEGIVWHHQEYGWMTKIKGKDFGFKRPSYSRPPSELKTPQSLDNQ